MQPDPDDIPWWDDDNDDWSEELYYNTLADYFRERYETLTARYHLSDCE